jgi:hypothetical protein
MNQFKIKQMKTITMILALTLTVFSAAAQEHVTLNVTQDARLLLFGDNKGNEPVTIDVTIASEWQGKQFNSGYMFVRPEFEYADLIGGIYRRYSANVGWTFNQWVDKLDFSASLGYGVIDYNGGYRSFGSNFQTSIEVFQGVKFFLDTEILDRKDLQFYQSEEMSFTERIRFSGKIGFKINLK